MTRAGGHGRVLQGWRADWVEPVPVVGMPRRPQRLRRSFLLERAVTAASVRLSARGTWSLFVNDHRVDAAALSPEPEGDGRLAWHRFDVTGRLRRGENVLGLIVGSSWETGRPDAAAEREPLAVLLELDVEFEDGDHLTVVSDERFRAKPGAIVSSADAPGEVQDHRLREAGWKLPGYDDADWTPVRRSIDQGLDALVYRAAETTRIVAEVPAVAVSEPGPGIVRADLGRSLRGRARIAFTETAGTRVDVEYIGEDGEPAGRDAFVAAGTSDEVFDPGFAFHVFRALRITGLRHPDAARFAALEFGTSPDTVRET